MDNPEDILGMPFVEDAKEFFMKYSESNLEQN